MADLAHQNVQVGRWFHQKGLEKEYGSLDGKNDGDGLDHGERNGDYHRKSRYRYHSRGDHVESGGAGQVKWARNCQGRIARFCCLVVVGLLRAARYLPQAVMTLWAFLNLEESNVSTLDIPTEVNPDPPSSGVAAAAPAAPVAAVAAVIAVLLRDGSALTFSSPLLPLPCAAAY